MDIAPYIADLLRQHNEVNVPSLGTFYKQRKGGYYDPAKGYFFPPSHGLAFKETEDDTSLTSYISQQKNISPNTANYFIEKFGSQIKSLMATYGQAEIDSLGTLKRSKDGYLFIDVLNFDDEGEYIGLQPVKELTILAALPVSEPVLEPSVNNAETEPSPTVTTEIPSEEIVEESKKVSSATKVILIAASIILLGIITYLVYPQAFETFRQKSNTPEQKMPAKPVQATIPKTLSDSIAEADTIYQQLSKQGFDIEKPRDTLEVSTEVTTVSPEIPAVSFEIIGAAFARRSQAENYVKLLKGKGVYAKIVENMPGSKLKISLGTFNDEASAKKELIRIQKELNKDAWIARVKPKKTN